MKKDRVLWADDEIDLLKPHILFLQEKGYEVVPVISGQDAIDCCREESFDIIFLDVQMRFLDGMTTAKLIRQQDSEVAILFITNMAQYAIRGYEVDAMDYMLKPVSYTTFCQRMGRVLSRLKQRVKHFITVPIKGGAMKLAVDDIYYVESQGHRLIYYTKNGSYTSSGTITEAERTLEGMHFFRSNKGYLLNLECVDGIQDNCAIINGQKLQISRSRKAAFLDALTRHIGGVL